MINVEYLFIYNNRIYPSVVCFWERPVASHEWTSSFSSQIWSVEQTQDLFLHPTVHIYMTRLSFLPCIHFDFILIFLNSPRFSTAVIHFLWSEANSLTSFILFYLAENRLWSLNLKYIWYKPFCFFLLPRLVIY